MNVKLILLFSAIIGTSLQYGHKPKPDWDKQENVLPEWVAPAPDHGWKPHVPAPVWRPSTHTPEWKPPAPEFNPPKPIWHPNPSPENRCKIIPKNAYNVEFTPATKTHARGNAIYPCDSTSVVKQLSYSSSGDSSFTCNGIIVVKSDDKYDIAFNGGQSHSQGYESRSPQPESLNLVNYTQIFSHNNGNLNYVECGIVSGGRCSGDLYWGSGIYQANDQNACVKGGVNTLTGIFRQIEIVGKCSSRCTLGSSITQFNPPVNNYGLIDRNVISNEDNDE